MQEKATSQNRERQLSPSPFPWTTASGRVVRTPEPDGGRPVTRFAEEPGSRSHPATGSPPVKVLVGLGGRGVSEASCA